MLTEICAEIRNYFTHECDKRIGDFAIVNGAVAPLIDFPTDYIRIVGSRKNDGVHKLSDDDLVDEGQFHGAIWLMSIPPDFLSLVSEIASWQELNGKIDSAAMSPFNSESFGGYSYSKSGGGSASGGGGSGGWKSAFASRLNPWRKI